MLDSICKRLILLVLLGATLLGPLTARAASYQDALDDYSDQKFSRSYKKAISLAREKRGTRRGKALILAAAAVLELDREQKARVLFKKAMDEDPDLDLPEVVRSRRAQRFFADLRDGREPRANLTQTEETTTAFDRLETYLPLGVNQLLQGKIFLGLTLGTAQVAGVYFGYAKFAEANSTEEEALAIRQRAIQTGNDINPVFLDLDAKNTAFVKNSRQISQLSFGLAALAYGASVLDASLRAPSRSRLQVEVLNPLHGHHGLQLCWNF